MKYLIPLIEKPFEWFEERGAEHTTRSLYGKSLAVVELDDEDRVVLELAGITIHNIDDTVIYQYSKHTNTVAQVVEHYDHIPLDRQLYQKLVDLDNKRFISFVFNGTTFKHPTKQ